MRVEQRFNLLGVSASGLLLGVSPVVVLTLGARRARVAHRFERFCGVESIGVSLELRTSKLLDLLQTSKSTKA